MLLFAIFIIIFFLTNTVIKDSISKLFIWGFVMLWGIQIILSQTGIFGINIPNSTTILYVSLHLLSFYIGFSMIRSRFFISGNSFVSNYQRSFLDIEKITKNGLFLLLFTIIFLYVASVFIESFSRLMYLQSLGALRTEYYEGLLGTRFSLINKFLLKPLNYVFLFLFGYMTFKKRNILWIFLGLYLFMYHSLGGGRFGYMTILMSVFFFGAFFAKNTLKRTSFLKEIITLIFLTIVAFFVYVIVVFTTAARGGSVGVEKNIFIQNIEETNNAYYSYYVGPIAAFDYSVNHDLPSIIGGYKFGTLTFSSVEELASLIFQRIGIVYKRPLRDYTEFVQDRPIEIGKELGSWNALYTWCNYFYCDLGVLGLIIFPFIIGILVRKVIEFFYKSPNFFSGILLVFAFTNLMISMLFFFLHSISDLIVIMVCLYFGNRRRSKAWMLTKNNGTKVINS